MVKKIKLSYPSDRSYYKLIGISCHLKDYRVIYNVNRTLKLHFRKQEDFSIVPATNQPLCNYALFHHYDYDRMIDYYFFANHHPDAKLLQEIRQADYFLMMAGDVYPNEISESIRKLLKLPEILAAFSIDPDRIKVFDHLITDLELHMLELKQ